MPAKRGYAAEKPDGPANRQPAGRPTGPARLSAPSELKQGSKVVGVKQTKRAVNDGKAARVFLAEDADPRVTAPVEALCAEKQIPVERVPQMKELGSACGIAVPSAVAALLH
mgnify:CR=1 FL=1